MVSSHFQRLSMDQVTTVYRLVLLLRRLRVIGTLELDTTTVFPPIDTFNNYDIIDMTENYYGLVKLGYNPVKGQTDIEELLEKIFGQKNLSHLRIT